MRGGRGVVRREEEMEEGDAPPSYGEAVAEEEAGERLPGYPGGGGGVPVGGGERGVGGAAESEGARRDGAGV